MAATHGAAPKVLIVEDHAILSQSLATALRAEGFHDVEVLGEDELADAQVLAAQDRLRPDVVLLDLHLGGERLGIPLVRPMTERGARVLVLTASRERPLLAECLEAGAAGLFDKAQPFDQLVALILDAAAGLTVLSPAAREELLAELRESRSISRAAREPFERLTDKERQVLAAIVEARTADEIAAEMVVSVATVRTHIQSMLRKLGVNSQLAAVALARRAGWPDG